MNYRIACQCLLSVFCLILGGGLAHGGGPAKASPPAKVRVAVVAPLHFATNSPDDRALGASITEVLAIALADHKSLAVVERRQLTSVLQEQKLAASGLVDPATAARVGKLLAADLVVSGSIVEADGKLRYAVQVIAVNGQTIVGSVTVDGTRKDLERSLLDLSSKVAALAGVKLPAIRPEDLDDSPVGRLHLMRGVSFYHANNDDQAIAYCLRAVRLDPRLQEARLWIARAYLRQHDVAHARAELKLLQRNPDAARQWAGQIEPLLAECVAPRKSKAP
jgi:TolB-like protein